MSRPHLSQKPALEQNNTATLSREWTDAGRTPALKTQPEHNRADSTPESGGAIDQAPAPQEQALGASPSREWTDAERTAFAELKAQRAAERDHDHGRER